MYLVFTTYSSERDWSISHNKAAASLAHRSHNMSTMTEGITDLIISIIHQQNIFSSRHIFKSQIFCGKTQYIIWEYNNAKCHTCNNCISKHHIIPFSRLFATLAPSSTTQVTQSIDPDTTAMYSTELFMNLSWVNLSSGSEFNIIFTSTQLPIRAYLCNEGSVSSQSIKYFNVFDISGL